MQHLGDITSPARPRILNWVNNSGYDCPAFGVFRVGDITESMDSGDDLIISGEVPDSFAGGYVSEVYAVNSSQAVKAGGKGRCTLDFPTYAAFDMADGVAAAGQVWGPKIDFKLHAGRAGFVILGNPVNGVVAVTSQTTPITKMSCKETLKPGIFADAYPMVWNIDEEVWEKISIETTVSVYGGSGWKGVIFGIDTTGLEGEDNISLIDAWYSPHSGNWYALGKGWSAFQGTATTDGAHGTTISVTPQDYAFSVPAVVKYGAVLTGDKFPVIWSDDENECQIQPSGTGEVGCGLVKTDGVMSLDYDGIVDDGLEVIPGTGEACDTIGVKAGCNVIVDADGVSVDTDSLAGDGLTVSEDTCKKIKVKAGCNTLVDGDGIHVDTSTLPGDGLQESATGDCKKLEVKAKCGIEVDGDGVGVKTSDLEGVGIVAAEEGCALNIALDRKCHITGTGNEVGIDLDAMVAGGVIEVVPGAGEACDTLDVKVTCGLTKAGGELGVDFEALVGTAEDNGLEVIEGGGVGDCDIIGVKVGCHLAKDADGLNVDLDTMIDDTTSGLKVVPGATEGDCPTLAINHGCHLGVDAGKLYVTATTLIFNPTVDSGLIPVLAEEAELCDTIKVNVDDSTVYINGSNQVAIKPAASWTELLVVTAIDDTDPCNLTYTVKKLRLKLPTSLYEIVDP